MRLLLIVVLLVVTLCTATYADCSSESSSSRGFLGGGGGLFARIRERRQARREARAERRLGAANACASEAEAACASACGESNRYEEFEVGCAALASTLQQETLPSVLAKHSTDSKVPCILVSDVMDSAKLVAELKDIIRGRTREA